MAYLQLLLVLCTVLNSIFYINARFVAIPASTSNLKAVLKQPLELRCQYDGSDDNGQFTGWYKDDIPLSSEKPGHYVVKNDGKTQILIIKIFVKADAEVKRWYVKTDKPGNGERPACEFGPIQLKPSPQGIATDRENEKVESAHGSVRRNEDESIKLICIIDPADVPSGTGPQWQFSKDDKTFTDLPTGVIVQPNGEINIDQVKKAQRGYYRCTLNDVHFTVLLRVKDRLAALWPFIGIVGVVLVLVIVILIFEKRQKSNKKTTATDDDEHDQANDPLVRTTTKASDNDSKKRAVKA